jgi:aspartyl-tRNA(Asn)/glutamyl-tRNA(Gln) amidotransferase subunit A
VILGKLKTVEFALGSSGTNYSRGTPRNPWDAKTFRVVSGSSSGAGVATAAGLCGFAIGSDTGGSVRGPAAYCGVVGVKTTVGLWPLDGVFPLAPTFDTAGPLARSADDAALVMAALLEKPVAKPAALHGLRLGRPKKFFFEGMDEHVGACMEAALSDLAAAGAEIVEVDLPEIAEATATFIEISRPEAIAVFGRERFLASRDQMNPDVADRASPGLETTAERYIQAIWRHRHFCEVAREAMREVDAWVGPTKFRLPPPFPGKFTSIEEEKKLVELCAGPTRVGSAMGLCAASLPIQRYGAPLPVGFQLISAGGQDSRLVSMALALESVFGPPPRPDLSGFL